MLHTFNSLFEIYPDTISDGEIVIGFRTPDSKTMLTFPCTLEVGDAAPDEKGRYHASDIGLLLMSVWTRIALDAIGATQAWFGNNICADVRTKYNCFLEEVRFADNVTAIGEYALVCCFGLKSVTIPDSVITIDIYAFHGCNGLTSISIPDSVKAIGALAFCGCTSLTTVNLPRGLSKINDGLFWDCTSLESIDIPGGVIAIGDYAFYDCCYLTSITIPSSVTSIGNYAFYECTTLTDVYVDQPESDLLDKADVSERCTVHWKQVEAI